jgi:hypothetical protein
MVGPLTLPDGQPTRDADRLFHSSSNASTDTQHAHPASGGSGRAASGTPPGGDCCDLVAADGKGQTPPGQQACISALKAGLLAKHPQQQQQQQQQEEAEAGPMEVDVEAAAGNGTAAAAAVGGGGAADAPGQQPQHQRHLMVKGAAVAQQHDAPPPADGQQQPDQERDPAAARDAGALPRADPEQQQQQQQQQPPTAGEDPAEPTPKRPARRPLSLRVGPPRGQPSDDPPSARTVAPTRAASKQDASAAPDAAARDQQQHANAADREQSAARARDNRGVRHRGPLYAGEVVGRRCAILRCARASRASWWDRAKVQDWDGAKRQHKLLYLSDGRSEEWLSLGDVKFKWEGPPPAGAGPNPTHRPELDRAAAVGRRLRLYWPAMQRWYVGQVKGYDAKTDKHTVRYKDGDAQQLCLRHEPVLWLEDDGSGGGGGGSGSGGAAAAAEEAAEAPAAAAAAAAAPPTPRTRSASPAQAAAAAGGIGGGGGDASRARRPSSGATGGPPAGPPAATGREAAVARDDDNSSVADEAAVLLARSFPRTPPGTAQQLQRGGGGAAAAAGKRPRDREPHAAAGSLGGAHKRVRLTLSARPGAAAAAAAGRHHQAQPATSSVGGGAAAAGGGRYAGAIEHPAKASLVGCRVSVFWRQQRVAYRVSGRRLWLHGG